MTKLDDAHFHYTRETSEYWWILSKDYQGLFSQGRVQPKPSLRGNTFRQESSLRNTAAKEGIRLHSYFPIFTYEDELCFQSLPTSGCHSAASGGGWSVHSELVSCISRWSDILWDTNFQSIKQMWVKWSELVCSDDYTRKIQVSFCHVSSQRYFFELVAGQVNS